jgi:hypothetical protein
MEKDNKEYRKQYYLNNKNKIKEYYYINKDKILNYQKHHYQDNKEKYNNDKKYIKQYYQDNKEKYKQNVLKNHHIKYNNDPIYKLTRLLRVRFHHILGGGRSKRVEEILGCSIEEFKQHIEYQFESWMNWSNMGKQHVKEPNKTWDIDHIIPTSSAKTEEEVYNLSHYTNLQPLCSYNNRFIKRNN